MDRADFFKRFQPLLENTKESNELDSEHDALIHWFGECCLGLDPDVIKERIVRDSHAEGIDSILIDEKSYSILFIQAQTVETLENTSKNFSENDLKCAFEGFRLLMGNYKGRITPELENLVDEYYELEHTARYKTEVVFLAMKEKPVDAKFIENFRKDFPTVDVTFYDINALCDIYENRYLVLRLSPPERISLEVVGRAVGKEQPCKSRVFTCKGKELAKIYNDFKERILDQDLRYSLGVKSKAINRAILETASDEGRSENFWYYNNGVTIVCEEIVESPSGNLISLKNAQIINGAQTTCALNEAFQQGSLTDDVEILVKAIETEDKDFMQRVTLYTNYQNPIRLRDLCANDAIQLKIKNIVTGSYGYYYDRKRGEFESQYPTREMKTSEFGPEWKARIVSNENAAQAFLAMYLDRPAQAKNEKGRIFLKEAAGFYNEIFNEEDAIVAEKLLLSWKLLKFVEGFKKTYHGEYKAAIDLPEDESAAVYKYDFLLHAEYFILNILRDFITNSGCDIITNRDHIVEMVNMIDGDCANVVEFYESIKEGMEEYISELRKDPKYYHNKFFKSETSIGRIRDFFHEKYSFVRA